MQESLEIAIWIRVICEIFSSCGLQFVFNNLLIFDTDGSLYTIPGRLWRDLSFFYVVRKLYKLLCGNRENSTPNLVKPVFTILDLFVYRTIQNRSFEFIDP